METNASKREFIKKFKDKIADSDWLDDLRGDIDADGSFYVAYKPLRTTFTSLYLAVGYIASRNGKVAIALQVGQTNLFTFFQAGLVTLFLTLSVISTSGRMAYLCIMVLASLIQVIVTLSLMDDLKNKIEQRLNLK